MKQVFRSLSTELVAEYLERDLEADAAKLVDSLAAQSLTLSFAESLTGGKLADVVVSVPGASRVFKGSAVTYATEAKQKVLGVDSTLLSAQGAVDSQVAAQMATNVRELLNTDVGASSTGVAGPSAQDGKPVGLVYLAISRALRPTYVFEINLAHRNLSDWFGKLGMESQREFIRIGAVKVLYGLLVTELAQDASLKNRPALNRS